MEVTVGLTATGRACQEREQRGQAWGDGQLAIFHMKSLPEDSKLLSKETLAPEGTVKIW